MPPDASTLEGLRNHLQGQDVSIHDEFAKRFVERMSTLFAGFAGRVVEAWHSTVEVRCPLASSSCSSSTC